MRESNSHKEMTPDPHDTGISLSRSPPQTTNFDTTCWKIKKRKYRKNQTRM